MQTTHVFSNVLQAQTAILLDTCRILDGGNIQYVIAGGWAPFLRGRHDSVTHRGTHDVDVLFNDEPKQTEKAAQQMLANDYSPSAKHEFQLLKKLKVGARDLIFNVDFMHPAETTATNMFHDIFDLGVKADYDSHITHKVKSICFPSSRIVFDENLWSRFRVDGLFPDGQETQLEIPLITEPASILSKCTSVSSVKRDRDAFDIFFVLTGKNGKAVAQHLKDLARRFPQVADQLGKLQSHLTNDAQTFDKRVLEYTEGKINDAAAQVLRSLAEP